jgi:methyltransferase (TIGR00027 family)
VIATARAIESTRPQAVRLFDDPYGQCFVLHPLTRAAVGIARLFAAPDLANRFFDRITGVSGLMTSFGCRTRCIDDALGSALNAGCKQVLILGAGYDCRTYRTPKIDKTKVFDIDHAATQEFKKSRLRTVIDPNQAHIVYVPVDFERDDLRERLAVAGFRNDRQSFVIWEGVSQYLRPESVDSVLRTVAAICTPESLMAFTYIHGGVLDDSGQFPEADKLVRRAGNAGEPRLFGLWPNDVAEFLRARAYPP